MERGTGTGERPPALGRERFGSKLVLGSRGVAEAEKNCRLEDGRCPSCYEPRRRHRALLATHQDLGAGPNAP
ncbi:hypothetical protein NDU88_000570 [Pleurodeles waltl]|uniref:Uncharacterized protein n=1 Tax=Pleurodeles waltl TaxID=8319 RepID=A0AAV7UQC7_PLEWA|nr:hypothetical protein NDU88_000570 [Pleurodeles waltl]